MTGKATRRDHPKVAAAPSTVPPETDLCTCQSGGLADGARVTRPGTPVFPSRLFRTAQPGPTRWVILPPEPTLAVPGDLT